jgi:hypothetical protein
MAAQCLQETNRLFGARVQETWKTCKEGGLSDAAKKVLGSLCEKYDNLHAMDKVAATLAKVDAVKLTMQVAAGPLECLECVSPPVAACSLLGGCLLQPAARAISSFAAAEAASAVL